MKTGSCSYCDVPEASPGSHRPIKSEPRTTWWRKVHVGHPNFPEEDGPPPEKK